MSVFRAIPSLKATIKRANRDYFQNIKSFSTSRVVMAGISDVIKHDHREIEDFYQNIVDANDEDTKVKWQNQLTWELARHSIGEELVVYPAMEKYLGDDGKSTAEKDRREHQVVH
jgi:hemerythrin superfamily protein